MALAVLLKRLASNERGRAGEYRELQINQKEILPLLRVVWGEIIIGSNAPAGSLSISGTRGPAGEEKLLAKPRRGGVRMSMRKSGEPMYLLQHELSLLSASHRRRQYRGELKAASMPLEASRSEMLAHGMIFLGVAACSACNGNSRASKKCIKPPPRYIRNNSLEGQNNA